MKEPTTTTTILKPVDIGETGNNSHSYEFDYITNEVLTAFCAGDHRAFEVIYMHCFEPIRGFFNMLLHNDAVAEELSQEMFARLWENRHMVNPNLNFRSYIRTAAKSSAMNYLRHKQVVDKYTNFKLNMEIDLGDAPDEELMVAELQLMISIALEKMPEQQRRVYEMSRTEKLSNDEIANLLGISESTVRVHLHKAMKELKRVMLFILTMYYLCLG